MINSINNSELHEWLWPKFIQQELDELSDRFNNHATRFDKNKMLPSGVSPNVAFSLHEQYGGENCLQPVDREVIHSLMEEIGEDVIRFVSVEYAARAEEVFSTLHVGKLTGENIWNVFTMMMPRMYEGYVN